MRQPGEICGHEIVSINGPQNTDMIVRTLIAHDPDTFHREQDSESLTCATIPVAVTQFLQKNRICFSQQIPPFTSNLTQDSYRQTRSWEWVAMEYLVWNSQ